MTRRPITAMKRLGTIPAVRVPLNEGAGTPSRNVNSADAAPTTSTPIKATLRQPAALERHWGCAPRLHWTTGPTPTVRRCSSSAQATCQKPIRRGTGDPVLDVVRHFRQRRGGLRPGSTTVRVACRQQQLRRGLQCLGDRQPLQPESRILWPACSRMITTRSAATGANTTAHAAARSTPNEQKP